MNKIREVNVLEIKSRFDANENLTIIDIRELDELEICKIEKTIHIPMMEIPNHISEFDKDDELIILCRSGSRSARVCHFLEQKGFNNVKNLNGGILEWIKLIDSSMSGY